VAKQIIIEVPDWVDEKQIKELVEKYLELNFPDKLSREEYLKLMSINPKDIVKFDIEKEIKIVKKLRKKSGERKVIEELTIEEVRKWLGIKPEELMEDIEPINVEELRRKEKERIKRE